MHLSDRTDSVPPRSRCPDSRRDSRQTNVGRRLDDKCSGHCSEDGPEPWRRSPRDCRRSKASCASNDHSDRRPSHPPEDRLGAVPPGEVGQEPRTTDHHRRKRPKDHSCENAQERGRRDLNRWSEPDALTFRSDGEYGQDAGCHWVPYPVTGENKPCAHRRCSPRQQSNPGDEQAIPLYRYAMVIWKSRHDLLEMPPKRGIRSCLPSVPEPRSNRCVSVLPRSSLVRRPSAPLRPGKEADAVSVVHRRGTSP